MEPTSTPTAGAALFAALRHLPSTSPTACRHWSARDVAAHLAAGAKELADLIERKQAGRPERPTRAFDEREAPFRALPYDELLTRLVDESRRKQRAYDALACFSDPTITFTGTRITHAQLVTHSRSEAAIHRWDLVGDDDVSVELLSDPELTDHAVWVLNNMPSLAESAVSLAARASAAGLPPMTVAFRTTGTADVVLHTDLIRPRFERGLAVTDVDAVVTGQAHHRLLWLWGRRPATLSDNIDDNLAVVVWPNAGT